MSCDPPWGTQYGLGIRNLCLFQELSRHYHLIVLVLTPSVLVPPNHLIAQLHSTKGPMKSSMMLDMNPEHLLQTPIGVPGSVSKCALFVYFDPATCMASANITTRLIIFPGSLLLILRHGESITLASRLSFSSLLRSARVVSHHCTLSDPVVSHPGNPLNINAFIDCHITQSLFLGTYVVNSFASLLFLILTSMHM